MIFPQEYQSRLASVQALMVREGLDALIIGASAQIDQRGSLRWLMDYYLSVYEECIIICPEGVPVYFAHDSLAAFHAGNGPLPLETRVIPPHLYATDPAVPAADYLRSIQAKSIGVAGTAGLSARFILSLTRQIGHAVRDVSMELARLRMIKSPAEIELSRAAVRLNEEAMWAYLKEVRPGALESDALAKGYAFAIGRGAEDQYWMSGSGNPAVVSHAVLSLGRTYRWKDEDNSVIVIEVSDTGGHYGEIWQPLKLGARDLELEEALAAVVRSIQAAAEMIRSGNTVGQVAAAAEASLVKDGWAVPRNAQEPAAPIGHGQGLDAWEIPSISKDNTELIVPGMRFNLHPVVTKKNGQRVSYCDCYISTDGAAERLSTLPYDVIYI